MISRLRSGWVRTAGISQQLKICAGPRCCLFVCAGPRWFVCLFEEMSSNGNLTSGGDVLQTNGGRITRELSSSICLPSAEEEGSFGNHDGITSLSSVVYRILSKRYRKEEGHQAKLQEFYPLNYFKVIPPPIISTGNPPPLPGL